MAAGSLKFLVVFFSKNKRLFIAFGAVLALIAALGAILTFTDWLVAGQHKQALAWTVVLNKGDWQGTPTDTSLPRFFVAGGMAFDRQILVEGWGMDEDVLMPVNYMEDLGIHVLLGEVTQVLYGGNKLQVFIAEKETGYQLITIAKGELKEGDLQIVFCNDGGTKLGYEEEFVYSVPLQYTLVDSGAVDSKGGVFMEVLDTETLPVLTKYNLSFLGQHNGELLLYIQGAKVTTIQRNETAIRIYTEEDSGFQIVGLDTKHLQHGKNTLRLIDNASLQVIAQLVYLVTE